MSTNTTTVFTADIANTAPEDMPKFCNFKVDKKRGNSVETRIYMNQELTKRAVIRTYKYGKVLRTSCTVEYSRGGGMWGFTISFVAADNFESYLERLARIDSEDRATEKNMKAQHARALAKVAPFLATHGHLMTRMDSER